MAIEPLQLRTPVELPDGQRVRAVAAKAVLCTTRPADDNLAAHILDYEVEWHRSRSVYDPDVNARNCVACRLVADHACAPAHRSSPEREVSVYGHALDLWELGAVDLPLLATRGLVSRSKPAWYRLDGIPANPPAWEDSAAFVVTAAGNGVEHAAITKMSVRRTIERVELGSGDETVDTWLTTESDVAVTHCGLRVRNGSVPPFDPGSDADGRCVRCLDTCAAMSVRWPTEQWVAVQPGGDGHVRVWAQFGTGADPYLAHDGRRCGSPPTHWAGGCRDCIAAVRKAEGWVLHDGRDLRHGKATFHLPELVVASNTIDSAAIPTDISIGAKQIFVTADPRNENDVGISFDNLDRVEGRTEVRLTVVAHRARVGHAVATSASVIAPPSDDAPGQQLVGPTRVHTFGLHAAHAVCGTPVVGAKPTHGYDSTCPRCVDRVAELLEDKGLIVAVNGKVIDPFGMGAHIAAAVLLSS